jgi:hypothetical protein
MADCLVLLRRNADAGNRHHPGGAAIDGRQVYVFAEYRTFLNSGIGDCMDLGQGDCNAQVSIDCKVLFFGCGNCRPCLTSIPDRATGWGMEKQLYAMGLRAGERTQQSAFRI